MSAIPNTGTWRSGTVNSTKYFDISMAGKCETGTSNRVKLDVQPAGKIPDFFTKNVQGKIVFAAPQVVGTIKAAKGHNSWVKIELKTVNGDMISDIAKHVCLGIKKSNEDDFFDIIHVGNPISKYVDVMQENYVELVPLLSKTATTESTGYIAVTPGTEITFTDITVPTTGEFNFGSVYRINVSVHDSQWLTDQDCDLSNIIDNDRWDCEERMGIGPVTDQNGVVHENQMFAVNSNGSLAYSSNGAHWTENGSIGGKGWRIIRYGNGIWNIIHILVSQGIRRSVDNGKSWTDVENENVTPCSDFGNGIFMSIRNNNVCTSPDAEVWTRIGELPLIKNMYGNTFYPSAESLTYGNNRWICIVEDHLVLSSENGVKWEQISYDLYQMWGYQFFCRGSCYANGYFYVIRDDGLIARSSNGVKWEQVLDFTANNTDADGNLIGNYYNLTYYKNKLWAFADSGKKYVVGLPQP